MSLSNGQPGLYLCLQDHATLKKSSTKEQPVEENSTTAPSNAPTINTSAPNLHESQHQHRAQTQPGAQTFLSVATPINSQDFSLNDIQDLLELK